MLKNFVRIKASPLKNSKFFYSTPKEILNFITYPWRTPWFLNQGAWILNVIATQFL